MNVKNINEVINEFNRIENDVIYNNQYMDKDTINKEIDLIQNFAYKVDSEKYINIISKFVTADVFNEEIENKHYTLIGEKIKTGFYGINESENVLYNVYDDNNIFKNFLTEILWDIVELYTEKFNVNFDFDEYNHNFRSEEKYL